ncbi:MAG TPA: hypothetical protein VED01_09310 [Burkholderiales bacterium]|nr:hypothetical protein [Burkholderiales bacterium]
MRVFTNVCERFEIATPATAVRLAMTLEIATPADAVRLAMTLEIATPAAAAGSR